MSFSTAEELGRTLVRLRLVEPSQLDECLVRLEPRKNKPADLLQVLEAKNYLTSYQISRLSKGETDQLVLGEYKLMYRNASGSFARVFRACSIEDGRMVGLKLLRQRWAKDQKTVREFHREAEVCKQLRHPNIVPIYEVGSDGDYHYFTMEFIEGGNLHDFINIRKKLSPVEATRCLLDMSKGLDYALAKGITHRDMKLSNVLLSTQGVAKLVDFWFGRQRKHHQPGQRRHSPARHRVCDARKMDQRAHQRSAQRSLFHGDDLLRVAHRRTTVSPNAEPR